MMARSSEYGLYSCSCSGKVGAYASCIKGCRVLRTLHTCGEQQLGVGRDELRHCRELSEQSSDSYLIE